MTAYRTVWTCAWFVALASGAAWAILVRPMTTVAEVCLMGASAAVVVGWALLDPAAATTTAQRLRALAGPAAWSGATSVSAYVLSTAKPGAGLLLAGLVAGTSPRLVAIIVRSTCATAGRTGRTAAGKAARPMTLVQLAEARSDSSERLRAAQSSTETLEIVHVREALLDEIEARRWPRLSADGSDGDAGDRFGRRFDSGYGGGFDAGSWPDRR